MPTTFLELLTGALGDVRAVNPNQTPSASMANFARVKHSEMLGGWSINRLRLSFIPEASYPLSAGVGSYAIGPGAANFDTTPGVFVKPVFIQAAVVIVGTARRWPLNILTRPQWDLNQSRTLSDPDGPLDLFYDFGNPIATINVAPMPTTMQSMLISQWNPLRTFGPDELALIVEDYFAPEYIKPMRVGLAIELAPSFGFDYQGLIPIFQEAIGRLEAINNEKLSGAFGLSRTLQGPSKGDGQPIAQAQAQ